MRLLWAATLCVACGLQAAPRRLARLSKRASSDGRRAVQTAAPAPVQPGQTTDENAAWPSRVELNTLKAGDAVHGFVDSPVVTGKNGVKVWLDCGVVRTRVRQDGSRDVMHVSGMVRLPPRPWPKTAEFAALKATLSTLRSPLVAYVSASREESAQLVLSPFPPRLVEDVETVELMPLSALKVGDALEGSNVVAFVGQGRAFITVDVWHDAPLSKKRDKPILALLRGWALPHNASLATAFKGDGVKRVVRKGDRLGPVFVRKVTPLSARLEVSLEKVDPAKAQKQRQRRAAGFLKKRKTLENLKVGHVVQASVVKMTRFGAICDIGTPGTGVIMRDSRVPRFVDVGQVVEVTVSAMVSRSGSPLAPRISLALAEGDKSTVWAKFDVEADRARKKMLAMQFADDDDDDDEDAGFDQLEDDDDIDFDLGLDTY
mmetsp:Transcript_32133/g.111056  ORF Transcript_32133/g.111056 Transcript_32133/m.111056 type:complete len:431 (+) Transcript_32133:41-1333(+)